MKKIAIIGAGFSGLSAAAYAARAGEEVHVFEQHPGPGGRARQFTTANGFTFDMGPSWYWMPDIIEDFFTDFNHCTSDFYQLTSLNPQFEIRFEDEVLAIPQAYHELKALFEHLEPGAGKQLDKFMRTAQLKYEIGMRNFAQKPSLSWLEYASPKLFKNALKLDLLTDFRSYVRRYFSHPKLCAIMEFPVIFLGASPKRIPAMYSLMNYGGLAMGTQYPQGGFFQLVKAMQAVAEERGARFYFEHEVTAMQLTGQHLTSLTVNGKQEPFDAVIATGDYQYIESLLPKPVRNYSKAYWESRTMAPSCLIYYLGLTQRLPKLPHHSLFFDRDFDAHLNSVYRSHTWPEAPLFYACCPSKTDPSVAPEGNENLFLLMPLSVAVKDNESQRKRYLKMMLKRLESQLKVSNLEQSIVYKRSYAMRDFEADYHAYRGNAYGLANTLRQTAVLKPKLKNKHLDNLLYAGQLTVPGPGVPPAIISGKMAAHQLTNLKTHSDEAVV